MNPTVANLCYLLAASLFIFGLKGLAHPRTAVRGNMMGAIGMLIAIVVTLLDQDIAGYKVIIAGMVVGGLLGGVSAIKIAMTAMPEFVAAFNGFGGGASVLVAGAYFILSKDNNPDTQLAVATTASGIIGAVTFSGSYVAFAKLYGSMSEKARLLPGRHLINIGLGVTCIGIGIILAMHPTAIFWYFPLVIVGLVLGWMLIIPIGGADMPVVIALLNSYSGLAAAATGFVLNNNCLIISGSLVGASGLILTSIMCKAMNRSLPNVLFGGLGAAVAEDGPSADEVYAGKIKATSADEIAMFLETAQRVVIVPGYGLAVSQAQHIARDLADLLEARGTTVEYGIHPVAGRMPGHMNVLLAEADVPYDKLKDMDEINPTFQSTDMAIVIGANDVVNPEARTNPTSPIAGMPILDVDKAKTVVVIKRSLSPGFAGIPNPLFAADNTLMYFGDGKKALLDLVAALKEI